jgi:hypothetical protein
MVVDLPLSNGGNQAHGPGALDRCGDLALIFCAQSGLSPGHDLASRSRVLSQ